MVPRRNHGPTAPAASTETVQASAGSIRTNRQAAAEIAERYARVGIDGKPIQARPDQLVERLRQRAVLNLPGFDRQQQTRGPAGGLDGREAPHHFVLHPRQGVAERRHVNLRLQGVGEIHFAIPGVGIRSRPRRRLSDRFAPPGSLLGNS